MSGLDEQLLLELMEAGILSDTCLELGSALETGFSVKKLCDEQNIIHKSTDIEKKPGLDFIADFESEFHYLDSEIFLGQRFQSIVNLNVLEHTFEPIKVLQNCSRLLLPGGYLIVTSPTIFPIHNYPNDCYRLLPDFYSEFAKKNKIELLPDYFRFMGYGKVSDYTKNGLIRFPEPFSNTYQRLKSKLVHRLFNTSGRGMFFPSHLQLCAVFRKEINR